MNLKCKSLLQIVITVCQAAINCGIAQHQQHSMDICYIHNESNVNSANPLDLKLETAAHIQMF